MEIGKITPPSLRIVDLWAAGKLLTTDDNTVVLPTFIRQPGYWRAEHPFPKTSAKSSLREYRRTSSRSSSSKQLIY
jgi:hypothetical protein